MQPRNERDILLVYDHQCPVCQAYCQRVELRPSEGRLRLIDARNPTDIRDEITGLGLDIDQGMVLQTGDNLYYGAEAIHQLSLLEKRSDPFNFLAYLAFRWRWASALIYPVLRFFRNLLLKILGRTKINNLLLPNNDKF
jgi:predicted DCC family thiol-disulfide oxidoreductase YuxK